MLNNYDSWLVSPMERAEAESERYYAFCESHGLDPNNPESERAYEDFCDELFEEPDYDMEEEDYYERYDCE